MIAIIGIVAAVIVLAAIALLFNRLVGLRNKTRYTWSDIEALLVRRAQAIPRLASVVEGAMAHERGVVRGRRAARAGTTAAAARTGPSEQRFEAERRLGTAGASLVARRRVLPASCGRRRPRWS